MIIKRMANFIRSHDWFAVVVEIVVVIVGLMLANSVYSMSNAVPAARLITSLPYCACGLRAVRTPRTPPVARRKRQCGDSAKP